MATYLLRLGSFVICLLSFLPFVQGEEQARRVTTVEGITEYQLDNGLKLLLFPDLSQSRVTVNMTVLVGSRHEGYGETGMAHLLEHLVFKGTPAHPNIPKALQDHGAQFNGSTNPDRTNYFETLAASDENLEFAIRMEADRLVNSHVRKSDLDSEFTVVRNEFESGENSPTAVLSKRIYATAFEWHNYGKSTIGNRSDIERVPIENLRAFYRKHYQPDNVVLVVAGQFREARALELVNKYFGAIPRPERKLETTYTEEPPQDGERTVTLRRVGDVAAIGVAYHVPAGPHEDSPRLQVLASILSTQPSGRLYKSLIETKKATSVYASSRGQHDPGLLFIQASVRNSEGLNEVRDIILREVEGIAESGVTSEEVERARQQILKDRELSAANTSEIAISLSEWAAQGDWRLYFLHRDRIEKVTADAVRDVARRYLARNNRTVGLFLPTEKAERIAIPSTPDLRGLVAGYEGRRSIAPGEAFDYAPASIEAHVKRTVLSPGVKAALLPKKSRGEEVHCVVTLRYGNEQNLRGLESADGFLASMMLRGTKQLTYQQLRDELDRLTATLSSGGGGGRRGRRGGGGSAGTPGSITFSIQAKRDTFPAVLEILRQVLREPLLPEDQFEIMKRERLAMLEQMRTEPSMLASNHLQRQLSPFPAEDVRYVPTVEESIQRLQRVTYGDVAKLYREYLGAGAGELAIVGDFDVDACLPVLEKTFAGWVAPQPYARIPTVSPSGLKGGYQQIDTPDKANATYLSGIAFPLSESDAEYAPLLIGNYIFGGGSLSSRLGTRVRQQEGLSYGVGASLSASSFEPRSTLTTNAICNPQNIGKVEKAMKEELERVLRDGVTAQELEDAKQGYLQYRKVSRASDASLASSLANNLYLNRTMSFDAELEKRIDALTTEQVNGALRRHIEPEMFIIVTAGDFQANSPGEK